MIRFILLTVLASFCFARPNEDFGPQNVITVPPNCPSGQAWINGQCRDIWRFDEVDPTNVITVPPNCPEGQEYINGECRDVWVKSEPEHFEFLADHIDAETQNMVTVPPNCKPGQQWINGQCRDVWQNEAGNPNNIITVPPNCPPGQEYINGACRDIWAVDDDRQQSKIITALFNNLKFDLRRTARQADDDVIVDVIQDADEKNRNIISIPNQCPNGYKPDALGVCREIFNY